MVVDVCFCDVPVAQGLYGTVALQVEGIVDVNRLVGVDVLEVLLVHDALSAAVRDGGGEASGLRAAPDLQPVQYQTNHVHAHIAASREVVLGLCLFEDGRYHELGLYPRSATESRSS